MRIRDFGEYADFGEFLSDRQMYVNQFHTWWPAMLANMAISLNMANWRIFVKSLTVCKLLPYMVASHVGESGEYGDFGKYGDFGEFLLNRQMYVNQFHTWWPAMLANLANMAISANSCQIGKCMSISSIPGCQPSWRIWRFRRIWQMLRILVKEVYSSKKQTTCL